MPARPLSRPASLIASLALLVGCASDRSSVPATPTVAEERGPVTVFAAASLTAPFTDAKAPLTATRPGPPG